MRTHKYWGICKESKNKKNIKWSKLLLYITWVRVADIPQKEKKKKLQTAVCYITASPCLLPLWQQQHFGFFTNQTADFKTHFNTYKRFGQDIATQAIMYCIVTKINLCISQNNQINATIVKCHVYCWYMKCPPPGVSVSIFLLTHWFYQKSALG